MIDVTKPETIPSEIEDIFFQYVGSFPSDIILEITNRKVENSTDIRCAIEKYLAPFHAEKLYKELLTCFNRTSIRCFHATKILLERSIRDNGLMVNNWERYSVLLEAALHQAELTEPVIKEAIRCVEDEYQRKYCFSNEPQLCFFTPLSAADGGESAGYDQFCQSVGGELARWALKRKMPNVYEALKPIGTPVIVEFELPFCSIMDHQKERLVYCFVTHYSAKKFWGMSCPIEFDGTTQRDVLPSQIIQIHQWQEVDYE